MDMNLGGFDRLIRTAIGVVLFFGPLLEFWTQYKELSMFFGVAMIATGLSGFCGLYTLLGFSTCKVENHKAH